MSKQTPLFIFDKNENLQTILRIDGDSLPFYSTSHKDQVFNGDTTKQSQAENSMQFMVPADSSDAAYVLEGNLVGFIDLDGNFQLFEIRTLDDYHDTQLYKHAYAVNVGQAELIDEWIDSLTLTSTDATTALTNVLSGTDWKVGTVASLGNQALILTRTNVLNALAQMVQTWGGEIRFRVAIQGNKITGRYVDWLTSIGSDTGKRFEYGKDISSIQRTADTSNLKTALYGYGASDLNGNRLTFANVVWTKANGDPVDKPMGQTWVGDPGALAAWGRDNGTKHRFGVYDALTETNATALLNATWANVQNQKNPLISYQLSVATLEELTGLSHEAIRNGDTVRVIDSEFNPPLRLTARILEYDRNLVDPQNSLVVLGNFLPTLAQNQSQLQTLQQTINNNAGKWDAATNPTVTDSNFPDTVPTAPTNFTADGGFKTIMLNWDYDTSSYIAAYELYASQTPGFTPDSTTLVWKGKAGNYVYQAATNQQWYFELRAINTHGTAGPFTAQINAQTVQIQQIDLSSKSVTTDALNDLVVTAAKLANGSVGTTQLASGAVTNPILASLAVQAGNLANGAVGTTQLANGAITNPILASSAVNTSNVVNAAITNALMAANSVATSNIQSGAVTSATLADLGVTSGKLADLAVQAGKLANGAVGTTQLANGAVTNAIMAANAVNTSNVVNAAITNALMASNSVGSSQIQTGSVSASQMVAGTITVTSGVIANAAITNAMLGSAVINTANIGNGQITNALLANAAVGTANIQNAAITTALIANLAVGTAAIQDSAITNAKIANLDAGKITTGVLDAARVQIGSTTTFASGYDPTQIQIGGSNLLDGTRDFSTGWQTNGATLDPSQIYLGLTPTKAVGAWSYYWQNYTVEQGKTYTLSAWVASGGTAMDVACYTFNSNGEAHMTTTPNQWTRFVYTFTIDGTGLKTAGSQRFRIESGSPTSSTPLWVCGIKLEEGNKATDWTPSFDDFLYSGTTLIDGGKIYSGTVTAMQMTTGTITASSGIIASAAITSAMIADGTISTADIGNAQITNALLGSASVATANIQNAAITSALVNNLAVGNAAIADSAINSAKIQDASIATADIGNAQITSALIGSAAVGTAAIQNGAITNALIASLSVGTAQLQDASITTAKIASLAVDDAHIASLNGSKINAGTVTADKLSVSDLSAITANLGTVTAGSIAGVTITGSDIKSTDETQTQLAESDRPHVEITGGKFTAYNKVNTTDAEHTTVTIQGQQILIDGFNGSNINDDGSYFYPGSVKIWENNVYKIEWDLDYLNGLILQDYGGAGKVYYKVDMSGNVTASSLKSTSVVTIDTGSATAAGMEIGSISAASTPYIDYHSSGFNNDYDVRMVASGGTSGTNGQGILNIAAAQAQINGTRLIKDAATWYQPGQSAGYANGFADWGDANYKNPIITQQDSNLVVFEGLMKCGTAGAAAFTLPTSMRPSKTLIFACQTGSKGVVLVYVQSNGAVAPTNVVAGDWVSLSGIVYIP